MKDKLRKFSKTRAGQVLPYLGVTAAVVAIAFFGSQSKGSIAISSMNMQAIASNDYSVSADQISEFYMVSELASTMSLPTAEAVNVNYNSLTVMRDIGQVSVEKLEKPDIVDTSHLSRGIISYTVGEGESLASIAAKYGVSEDQIRWSNSLKNSDVSAGTTLYVPSVPGIVYTAKDGDTVDSLAEKYKSSRESIISANDLEQDQSLAAGTVIILPGGELPETERPEYVAPSYSYSYTSNSSASSASSAYRTYWTSSNPMPWGWCTWYAWARRSQMAENYHLPGGLGNANTWAAALSGTFRVNNTPRAGAVMQTGAGYYGHVAIVDKVNADGSVTYSDMNGISGWGRVGTATISASQAAAYRYIHDRL